jgi:uncharacterized SAM-binding protein YcdF (DUF218 family)
MPNGSTDAIVVPGGGLLAGGELPPWVENRLERVLETADGDAPVILLSAGTVYKPHPVDSGGRPIFESCAAAEWLKRRGLPARRLFVETASYDTIGNAYFLRAIHTDPRGWRRLRVVTSEFHMPRLRAIFTWVFGAPPASRPYELNFESVPDVGLSFEVRAKRAAKEAQSLASTAAVMSRIRTMPEIHEWLFTEHRAYAVACQGNPPDRLPEGLIETY